MVIYLGEGKLHFKSFSNGNISCDTSFQRSLKPQYYFEIKQGWCFFAIYGLGQNVQNLGFSRNLCLVTALCGIFYFYYAFTLPEIKYMVTDGFFHSTLLKQIVKSIKTVYLQSKNDWMARYVGFTIVKVVLKK